MFHQAWEMQSGKIRVYTSGDPELKDSRRSRVAKYVVTTKEVRGT